MKRRGTLGFYSILFLIFLTTHFNALFAKKEIAHKPTLQELVDDMESQYGKKPGELTPLLEAIENPNIAQRDKELLERFARSALDAEIGNKKEEKNKRLLWRSPQAPHKTREESLKTAQNCAEEILEKGIGRLPLLVAAQKIAKATDFENQHEKLQPPFSPERAFEAAWCFFDAVQNIGSLAREFALNREFSLYNQPFAYMIRTQKPANGRQDFFDQNQLHNAFTSAAAFSQFFQEIFSVDQTTESQIIDETKMLPIDIFMHCLPVLASRLKAKKLPSENRQWLYFAAKCMTTYNSARHGDPAGLRRLTRFPVLSRSLKITATVAALSNLWRCCEEVWSGYKEQRDATHEYPFSPQNIAEIRRKTEEWEKKQRDEQKAKSTKANQIQHAIKNNIATLKRLEEEGGEEEEETNSLSKNTSEDKQ